MRITILGGGGFLGQKVAARLAARGTLAGKPIAGLTLFDLAPPATVAAGFPVQALGGDIAELPAEAIPEGTDVVFHLAAVVSAAAEADYDLGQRVNIGGAMSVIEAARRLTQPPRVVFTGTVASFGGGQGARLPDDARQVPEGSYGAQKAVCELLLADASRRGFLDAVSIRLPTIIIRPGRPNKAASSFISAILREPLLGLETELPVSPDFEVWVASPRRAVDWLLHSAALDTAPLGADRGINPPGMVVTVAELLAALDAVSPGASHRVKRVEAPLIERIVSKWPGGFLPVRAQALGYAAHEPLEAVVQAFIEDDLAATKADRGLG